MLEERYAFAKKPALVGKKPPVVSFDTQAVMLDENSAFAEQQVLVEKPPDHFIKCNTFYKNCQYFFTIFYYFFMQCLTMFFIKTISKTLKKQEK